MEFPPSNEIHIVEHNHYISRSLRITRLSGNNVLHLIDKFTKGNLVYRLDFFWQTQTILVSVVYTFQTVLLNDL